MDELRTPALDALILRGLSDGIPLRQLGREHGFSKSSFYRWRDEDEIFRGLIARARDLGYDAIADRLRNTARGKCEGDDGESTGDTQRDKLIIETDLKLLAKWSPRYADRLVHAGDKEAPLRAEVTVSFVKS